MWEVIVNGHSVKFKTKSKALEILTLMGKFGFNGMALPIYTMDQGKKGVIQDGYVLNGSIKTVTVYPIPIHVNDRLKGFKTGIY